MTVWVLGGQVGVCAVCGLVVCFGFRGVLVCCLCFRLRGWVVVASVVLIVVLYLPGM